MEAHSWDLKNKAPGFIPALLTTALKKGSRVYLSWPFRPFELARFEPPPPELALPLGLGGGV